MFRLLNIREFVKESLLDLRGYPSNTRLKSWYLMRFTFWFIPFYVVMMVVGVKFAAIDSGSILSYLIVMGGILVSVLTILLTAVFYPAQLNKKIETREVIEISRILNKDILNDGKESEDTE